MATSRETARDALTTLLDAGLTTKQEVVGHKLADPAGKSPIVAVLSAGTLRQRLTFQGTRPTFYLTIQVLVLAEDQAGYTEADAEDTLDTVESEIAAVLEDNWRTSSWESLEQTGPSEVIDVSIGGVAYYLEEIPVAMSLATS